jgi:hypothetical protein
LQTDVKCVSFITHHFVAYLKQYICEFSASSLDGQWSASNSGRFTPGTFWIGGCFGSRTRLSFTKEWITPSSASDHISAVLPAASHYTDWRNIFWSGMI